MMQLRGGKPPFLTCVPIYLSSDNVARLVNVMLNRQMNSFRVQGICWRQITVT